MSKLEVEISGNVKKLKSAINDATGQLKGLARQGANTGNKVSSNFKLAGRSAGQAGIQIQQFVGQIQGGQNPLVAFSQQAADLGFVMGVPLAGAIASIGAALVSFLIPSLIKSKKEAKGLNEEFKSQTKILKELIKNYGQFDKIRITSRFNTIKEREELKALNLNVLDYTESEETRIRALKELIKLYPRYFKGLDISQTNALIKAEDAVNKVLLRKQKLKQTLIKLEEATQKLENNLIELNEKRGSFNIKDIERVKVLDSQNLKLRDQIKLLREALELFVSYDTSFKELQNQKPIVVPITMGQPTGLTRVDTGVSVAALQAQIKALKDQQTQISKTSEQWKEYALKIKEVQKQLELITKGDAESLLGNTIAGQIAAEIEAINIHKLKEKMQEIQFSANMLSQSIQQSFANITNSISRNLQNSLGFLGSFLGELLSFFTQVIQARIRQQVQEMALAKKQQIINAVTAKSQLASDKVRAASSATVAASNTAKSAGPKGAFLLPLLIAGALGAVSSAFSKIGGSGGSFGGSSVAGAGSSSGFSSGTTFGGTRPFSGNLTFTIRGTDLVAVYNLANSQNAIIGGNVSVG